MKVTSKTLKVLVWEEDGGFTAQMLELNFAGHGSTEPEAISVLARTLIGQVRLNQRHGRAPLDGVKAAPERFWAIWRTVEFDSTEVPGDVPEPHVIQATLDAESYRLNT